MHADKALFEPAASRRVVGNEVIISDEVRAVQTCAAALWPQERLLALDLERP